MKAFSPKSLFSISSSSSPSSPYRIFIAYFSNSSNYSPRRFEEDSRNVRVSVWWDFENCQLPSGVNVFKVANTITAAIRANGIKGPVTITAFGDVVQMSRANQEALSSTGINIAHVPNGGKNSADRSLLVDLMYWVSQNPPPAHLFLISGDRDFASILHRLRMNNYNILLASREFTPNVLCSAASIMWNWDSLVRGENLAGKHFNQPPDGPYGSWYGHYKGPLLDPFAVAEQPANSCIDGTPEPVSDSKLRPVPKTVVRQNRVPNMGPLLDPFAVAEQPANSLATSCTDETPEPASDSKLRPVPKTVVRQNRVPNMGPLLDPFAVAEQPANSLATSCTDETPEPASDSKLRPVPKPVIRQIRHILNSYPKGLTITDLRLELSKSPVTIDKDLYGYKKFSRFLLSMPNILKLQSEGSGVFLVFGITPKAPEPFETSLGTSNGHVTKNGSFHGHFCKNGDQELSKSLKLNGDERLKNRPAKDKLVLPSTPEAVADHPSEKVKQISLSSEKVVNKKVLEPAEKVQQIPPIDKNIIAPVGVQEDEGHLPHVLNQCSVPEVGFFKKIWLRWFGGEKGKSEIKSQHTPEKCSDLEDIPETISQKPPESPLACDDGGKKKLEVKYMKSSTQDGEPAQSVQEEKTATSAQPCGDKSTASPGFLSRIVNWLKFERNRSDSDTLSGQSTEGLNQINCKDQKHEIFLKDSFWSDMESFMDSPRGSVIISQSRTRKQMARSLKEEGPLVLKDLTDCDTLDLVALLISEKKWVEEYPSEKSPFKLSGLLGKQSSLDSSHPANGLRSIFLNTPSESVRLKVQRFEEEKKSPNIPHAGVSASAINKLPSDRPVNDVIADCQKLVDEILKEYPDGYNMISFRKLFMERYGYRLDLQKLGYQKLASLLQIMPGVKIESNHILPSSKVLDTSDSELSETSKKNDDSDSQWEELGPVSNLSFDRKEVQSRLKFGAMKEMKKQTYPDYEPSVSDDEFSDSEGDTSAATQPERQRKPGVKDEDSSLLQILDSWYSNKEEGDNKKNDSENVSDIVDGSSDTVNPCSSSEVAATKRSETSFRNSVRKQRMQKNYCFVEDPPDNERDKLIDGILGNLKKSSESTMHG